MSHFVNIVTEIRDCKALLKALERLGFDSKKVEVYDKPQNLYGYQGDVRKQKAHVIIRRKYVGMSSNDIGFEQQADGRFVAHISEFDQGTGEYSSRKDAKYNETWQNKLCTYYGVEKAKVELDLRGLKYFEDLDDKQRPRIKVRI